MTSVQSIDANPFHWPARRGSAMELVAYSKKNAANSQLIDEAVASVGTGPSPLACTHTHTHTHTFRAANMLWPATALLLNTVRPDLQRP